MRTEAAGGKGPLLTEQVEMHVQGTRDGPGSRLLVVTGVTAASHHTGGSVVSEGWFGIQSPTLIL